jgi:hypothetical protein
LNLKCDILVSKFAFSNGSTCTAYAEVKAAAVGQKLAARLAAGVGLCVDLHDAHWSALYV